VPHLDVPDGTEVLVHRLDEPVYGAWCDRCLLPSAIDATWLIQHDPPPGTAGLVPLGVVRLRVCLDCESAVQLAAGGSP
jgi:hypothetical protein